MLTWFYTKERNNNQYFFLYWLIQTGSPFCHYGQYMNRIISRFRFNRLIRSAYENNNDDDNEIKRVHVMQVWIWILFVVANGQSMSRPSAQSSTCSHIRLTASHFIALHLSLRHASSSFVACLFCMLVMKSEGQLILGLTQQT